MVSTITPVDNKQGKYPKLKLKQSITLLESLRSCWSEDILVISCSDKFLRLSLQLLSRSDFTSPVNVSHFLWYFGFTMQTFTYVHMYRLHTRARARTHTNKEQKDYPEVRAEPGRELDVSSTHLTRMDGVRLVKFPK